MRLAPSRSSKHGRVPLPLDLLGLGGLRRGAAGIPCRALESSWDMKIHLKDFRVPGGKKTRLKEWPTDIGPLYESERHYKKCSPQTLRS